MRRHKKNIQKQVIITILILIMFNITNIVTGADSSWSPTEFKPTNVRFAC